MPDPTAPNPPAQPSPCQACGACCAAFRVSFYWREAVDRGLPDALVERVNDHLLCLRGTWAARPRCAALAGEVGRAVRCTAYPQRPGPCREVEPGDAQCAKARAIHGLAPLVEVAGEAPIRGSRNPGRRPAPDSADDSDTVRRC